MKIRLQSIGWVDAIEVGEAKIGDYRLYNFGHKGKIIAIEPKGKQSVSITTESSGEQYTRTMKKSTLIAIA